MKIRLSEKDKIRILIKMKKKSFGKIAEEMHFLKSTIYSFVKKFDRTGTFINIKNKGAPFKGRSKRSIRKIVTFFKNNAHSTLDSCLTKLNLPICRQTLRKILKRNGVNYYSRPFKPKLKEKDKLQRIEWTRANKNLNYAKVYFLDETSVELL